MEQTPIPITARTRRQAMDWSLVLASQGIECIIDRPETSEGWGLLVADSDHAAALSAIRQYQLENRIRPWQQKVFQAGILFDWGGLAWAFLLIFFFWLDTRIGLHARGVMDTTA